MVPTPSHRSLPKCIERPERNKAQSAEVKDPAPRTAGYCWRYDDENLATDHSIRNISTGIYSRMQDVASAAILAARRAEEPDVRNAVK